MSGDWSDYGGTTARNEPIQWRAKGPAIPWNQRHKYDIAKSIECDWHDLVEEGPMMLLHGEIVALRQVPRMGGSRWRVIAGR